MERQIDPNVEDTKALQEIKVNGFGSDFDMQENQNGSDANAFDNDPHNRDKGESNLDSKTTVLAKRACTNEKGVFVTKPSSYANHIVALVINELNGMVRE
jgi:hypothetical protein